jgi:hypothetical protein
MGHDPYLGFYFGSDGQKRKHFPGSNESEIKIRK